MPITLKHIELSDVELNQHKQPQFTCNCCYEIVHPSRREISKPGWLIAAYSCGWRNVELPAIHLPVVCPECVEGLEKEDAKIQTRVQAIA